MKKVCFIPLRAGSKGIPRKNIKRLYDKPLFCWILDTILASKEFSEIWIATDCDEVKKIAAKRYPDVFVFNRSNESAIDTAPTIHIVKEFLLRQSYHSDDWFVLFQATSPFTSLEDINKLCRLMEVTKKDSMIACYRTHKFRWSSTGRPMDYEFESKPRRQDYAGILLESGSFYASKIGSIMQSGQLLTIPVETVELGKSASIDIDDDFDFAMAETYIKQLLDDGLL